MRIRQLESILVDLPTIRAHRLANQTVTRLTLVVLRLRTDDGLEGLGEATTIGGLSYGEEAPETIKVVLDEYVAPLLVGQDAGAVGTLMASLARQIRGNRLAKSAVETALLDLKGQLLGVPVSDLFGGARTETLEVAWGLATGDPDADVAEAEEMLAEGRHRLFKIKVGARDPNADVARVEAVIGAIGTRARVRIDANQAWDEPVARRAIERLEAAGMELDRAAGGTTRPCRPRPPQPALQRAADGG